MSVPVRRFSGLHGVHTTPCGSIQQSDARSTPQRLFGAAGHTPLGQTTAGLVGADFHLSFDLLSREGSHSLNFAEREVDRHLSPGIVPKIPPDLLPER